MEGAFLIGNGQIMRLEGPRGTTPECPEAKFQKGDVVKCRNLRNFSVAGQRGVVAAVVPPGFSPCWAWADLRGEPRPLMCQVPLAKPSYILAMESGRALLMKEKYLLPTGEKGEFAWAPAQPGEPGA